MVEIDELPSTCSKAFKKKGGLFSDFSENNKSKCTISSKYVYLITEK